MTCHHRSICQNTIDHNNLTSFFFLISIYLAALGHVGILVPEPEIKPASPTYKIRFLTTGPWGEVPQLSFNLGFIFTLFYFCYIFQIQLFLSQSKKTLLDRYLPFISFWISIIGISLLLYLLQLLPIKMIQYFQLLQYTMCNKSKQYK